MSSFKRIIFLGSSSFAVPSLKALIESEQFKPLAVVTQPDRPGGRNLQPKPTPVKLLALEHDVNILQPEDINSAESIELISALKPDLLITVAYGQKLKKAVREAAVFGAINLHPSLLPELRGAAPIPFALWQGMVQTGLTIFKLSSKMDAGPVFYKKPLFIFPTENATDLTARLAYIGSMCLLQFLQEGSEQPREPVEQDESKATYCRKLEKEDLIINWDNTAREIQNQIRALALNPGAYTICIGRQLKIMEADVIDKTGNLPPGSIVSVLKNLGFTVRTADKQLLVRSVQQAGKQIMSAWSYNLGARLASGERMGNDEH